MEADRVFGTKAFEESVAVNLLVESDHTPWHDKKLIGIGRCASHTKSNKQFKSALFGDMTVAQKLT